jgi:hypothetical protein
MIPYNTGSKQEWPGLPIASQLLPGVLLPDSVQLNYTSDPPNDLAGPLQAGSPAPWFLSDLGVVAGASEPLWDVATLADLPQQLNVVHGSTAGGTASSLDFYPDLIEKPPVLHPGPGFVLVQQQQQVDMTMPTGASMLGSPPLQLLDLSGAMGTPLPSMQQVHLPLSSIMASHSDQQLQIMQHSQAPTVAPHAASAAQGPPAVGMAALYQQVNTHVGLPPMPARATSGRSSRPQQQQQQQQLVGRQLPAGVGAAVMPSPLPPAPTASGDAAGDSFWTRAAAQAARLQAEGGRRPGGRRSHCGPTLTYVTPAPPSGPGPGRAMAGSTITAQPGSFSEQMSELLGSLKEGSAGSGQAASSCSPSSVASQQQQQQLGAFSAGPMPVPVHPVARGKPVPIAGHAGSMGAAHMDQRPGLIRRPSANGSSSLSSSSGSSTVMAPNAPDLGNHLLGAFSPGHHLLLPQGSVPTEALGAFSGCGPSPTAGAQGLPMPPGLQLLQQGSQPSAAAPQWVIQQAAAGGHPGLPVASTGPGFSHGAATWPGAPW